MSGQHRRGHNRVRKFIGALIMVGFVCVYGLIAMALAQARFVVEAEGALQFALYAVLGLAWIIPMMPLIAWMEAPKRTKPAPKP